MHAGIAQEIGSENPLGTPFDLVDFGVQESPRFMRPSNASGANQFEVIAAFAVKRRCVYVQRFAQLGSPFVGDQVLSSGSNCLSSKISTSAGSSNNLPCGSYSLQLQPSACR